VLAVKIGPRQAVVYRLAADLRSLNSLQTTDRIGGFEGGSRNARAPHERIPAD